MSKRKTSRRLKNAGYKTDNRTPNHDLAAEAKAAADGFREAMRGLGLPADTLDELEHAARVVGIPYEVLKSGDYTPADVLDLAAAAVDRARHAAWIQKPRRLMTITVACETFNTSPATLKRYVADGKLRDYRGVGAVKNSPILLSESELEARFTRRNVRLK